jgi:hypothetical protein
LPPVRFGALPGHDAAGEGPCEEAAALAGIMYTSGAARSPAIIAGRVLLRVREVIPHPLV